MFSFLSRVDLVEPFRARAASDMHMQAVQVGVLLLFPATGRSRVGQVGHRVVDPVGVVEPESEVIIPEHGLVGAANVGDVLRIDTCVRRSGKILTDQAMASEVKVANLAQVIWFKSNEMPHTKYKFSNRYLLGKENKK